MITLNNNGIDEEAIEEGKHKKIGTFYLYRESNRYSKNGRQIIEYLPYETGTYNKLDEYNLPVMLKNAAIKRTGQCIFMRRTYIPKIEVFADNGKKTTLNISKEHPKVHPKKLEKQKKYIAKWQANEDKRRKQAER